MWAARRLSAVHVAAPLAGGRQHRGADRTGEPAAVLVVGEGTVLLRHLGGELQQEPLVALAPDPLDPANTYLRHASRDAF